MKDSSNRIVTLVLLGWLCFAVGLSGWLYDASAQAVATTVWTLTALALFACWKISPIRLWVLSVDLRWLVLVHVTRLFAGTYFLLLCQRSQLPCGDDRRPSRQPGRRRSQPTRRRRRTPAGRDDRPARDVLSFTLSARSIAMRVRKNGGLGRHRYRGSGRGCGWRDAH